MPPKGTDKVKSKEQVVDPDGVEANVEVKVELVTGEKDAHNLEFHTKAEAAWSEVTAKFPDIESEAPLIIPEGGSQLPVCQKDLEAALKATRDTYVCGVNFAWANPLFSVVPGVPVHMPAVMQVRDNMAREPRA